jgi:hypothetical protein
VAAKRSPQLPQQKLASTLGGLTARISAPQRGSWDGKDSPEKRGPFRRFKISSNHLFFNTYFFFVKDKTLKIS